MVVTKIFTVTRLDHGTVSSIRSPSKLVHILHFKLIFLWNIFYWLCHASDSHLLQNHMTQYICYSCYECCLFPFPHAWWSLFDLSTISKYLYFEIPISSSHVNFVFCTTESNFYHQTAVRNRHHHQSLQRNSFTCTIAHTQEIKSTIFITRFNYCIRNSQTHTMNKLYLVNAQTATCFGLFLGHHEACITILSKD